MGGGGSLSEAVWAPRAQWAPGVQLSLPWAWGVPRFIAALCAWVL